MQSSLAQDIIYYPITAESTSEIVLADDDKLLPDCTTNYTADELVALITLYSNFHNISERKILIEYVNFGIDLLERKDNSGISLGLLTEIAELRRRKIIRIPKWIDTKLEKEISLALESAIYNKAEIVLPLLTLHLINRDITLERKAEELINHLTASAFDNTLGLKQQIDNLHITVICCDYVTMFDVNKSASLWNRLAGQAFSSGNTLATKQIFKLLEIANELDDYAYISPDLNIKLKELLKEQAKAGSIEAKAYSKFVELKF